MLYCIHVHVCACPSACCPSPHCLPQEYSGGEAQAGLRVSRATRVRGCGPPQALRVSGTAVLHNICHTLQMSLYFLYVHVHCAPLLAQHVCVHVYIPVRIVQVHTCTCLYSSIQSWYTLHPCDIIPTLGLHGPPKAVKEGVTTKYI